MPAVERKVGFIHAIGIFLMPYIFSWPLLRSGYSARARKISFTWMLVVLLPILIPAFLGRENKAPAPTLNTNKSVNDTSRITPEISEEPSSTPSKYVKVDRAEVRLSPAANGKITNTLFLHQRVDVYETKGGWVRISKFYNGEVEGMKGDVARWVALRDLSEVKPPEENLPPGSPAIAQAIKGSDDFQKHKDQFINASQDLIKNGRCTIDDFSRQGGWWKSSNHLNQPIYFTYCGGTDRTNRLYLNIKTGKVFSE